MPDIIVTITESQINLIVSDPPPINLTIVDPGAPESLWDGWLPSDGTADLWYQASDLGTLGITSGRVTSWASKIGNNDLSQVQLANQPVWNNEDRIEFQGVIDSLAPPIEHFLDFATPVKFSAGLVILEEVFDNSGGTYFANAFAGNFYPLGSPPIADLPRQYMFFRSRNDLGGASEYLFSVDGASQEPDPLKARVKFTYSDVFIPFPGYEFNPGEADPGFIDFPTSLVGFYWEVDDLLKTPTYSCLGRYILNPDTVRTAGNYKLRELIIYEDSFPDADEIDRLMAYAAFNYNLLLSPANPYL